MVHHGQPDARRSSTAACASTCRAAPSNPWDAIVGQNDIALVQGVNYTLLVRASRRASTARTREHSSGWRSTRSTPTSPPTNCSRPTTTSSSNTFEQPTVDGARPGRVPDRRLARPLDVLRRQRLPRRRRRERPQRRLLGRDRSVVHHRQPDADDRRRPAVRRRAGRHRQPVGRDRRTERHRPRPRRDLPLLVRRLVERGRQERARARRAVGRPVRRLLHRQRHCSRPTRRRRATPSSSRPSTDAGPGRVPDSAARPTPGRSASTTSRSPAGRRRAVRARHRAAGPRQPGRLPPRRAEGRDAGHRRDRRRWRGS